MFYMMIKYEAIVGCRKLTNGVITLRGQYGINSKNNISF